jgi:glycosyltransferase involved in cell wall biosynthesis
MRIAYASPLPPQPSGIADYSAELLPHLAEHVEIDLFVGGMKSGDRPDERLARRFPIHRLGELAALAARRRYDAVLYQMGNHPRFHGEIYRALLARPGVVVLHEYVLHHMIRELTLAAGDPAGYLEEVRYAAGRGGLALARRALATGVPLDPWRFPLFERAVDAAAGVIVHNQTTRRRVLASRAGASCSGLVESADARDGEASARARARAALGLPADALLLGTFGFLTAPKRLGVALRAFARLRREAPAARFLLVGEADASAGLEDLLAAGLGAGVAVVGRVERADFLAWMRAVDVAVNLRYPTAGETSGTLMRLLGLGKAVVVTDDGAFAEIPDGCCAKVPPGPGEEEILLAYLRRLAADGELRRAMGENARRHLAAHHSVAGSARAYAGFLAEVAAAGARPPPPPPPPAPNPPPHRTTQLIADLAADATDLGVADQPDAGDLLAGLAEAVVDLDLDRWG